MPRLRTPGPGAYDIPPHLSIGGSPEKRPSAAFASNSQRSSKGGMGDAGGDPGAYDIEHTQGKAEAIASRSVRSFNRDISSGKGSFISRSSRPTSAPPRSSRGGPGEHDYAHLYSCGHGSHQVTSAFMSAIPLGGHIRKSDTPGVGEYDPSDKERFSKKSFTKEGSYMFASSAKSRGSAGSTTTGENVGPGSYDLKSGSISARMTISTNPRLPGFGSSSVRASPASRNGVPAPGAYDAAANETVHARSARTYNTPASSGHAQFGSTSTRESRSKGEGTDKQYTVENPGVHTGKAASIADRSKFSFNRDISSGKGSFISQSKRSQTPPARSSRGGPGEHDYAHLYSCGHGSHQVTSAFMSAIPLGGHIRKSDTPGVGEYDPSDKERFSKKSFTKEGSYMFASSAKSRGSAGSTTTGENVGPGSYDLKAESIAARASASVNPRLPGFGSSSVRTGPED